MGIRNGRSSYTELKKKYEKVIIRHDFNGDGTARTTCFLVRDGNVFVGVSRFSNRTFTFNRKKGRAIAQGRAEHAVNVFLGTAVRRASQEKRREELSFIVKGSSENTSDDILADFLNREKEVVQV